jgi:hypothetical protein
MIQQWQKETENLLFTLTGSTVRNYSTFDFGREKNVNCISAVVKTKKAYNLLKEIRKRLPLRLLSFIGTGNWLGDEKHNGVEIVIGLGATQFDILRIAQSDAINYDMMTEDLIKKLQQYDLEFGIDIFHAETDTIEFNLLSTPGNITAFAKDLYEFCPDIVDQGVGSITELEKEIRKSNKVYLWWD